MPQGIPKGAEFSTTQWSLVLTAQDSRLSGSDEALAALCERYWYPVYAHVRRLRHDPDTAQDLTQGFFAHLLEKRMIRTASPERGRFRAFLKASIHNYLANERHRAQAQKRGGGTTHFSLDLSDAEARFRMEPFGTTTPETSFERSWARTILNRALERMRSEFSGPDASFRLRYLEPFLTGDSSTLRYRQVAARLGVSESTVKVAVHRLRQRFGDALRDEVAQTVHGRDQIDEELHHLLSMVRPPRPGR